MTVAETVQIHIGLYLYNYFKYDIVGINRIFPLAVANIMAWEMNEVNRSPKLTCQARKIKMNAYHYLRHQDELESESDVEIKDSRCSWHLCPVPSQDQTSTTMWRNKISL